MCSTFRFSLLVLGFNVLLLVAVCVIGSQSEVAGPSRAGGAHWRGESKSSQSSERVRKGQRWDSWGAVIGPEGWAWTGWGSLARRSPAHFVLFPASWPGAQLQEELRVLKENFTHFSNGVLSEISTLLFHGAWGFRAAAAAAYPRAWVCRAVCWTPVRGLQEGRVRAARGRRKPSPRSGARLPGTLTPGGRSRKED